LGDQSQNQFIVIKDDLGCNKTKM